MSRLLPMTLTTTCLSLIAFGIPVLAVGPQQPLVLTFDGSYGPDGPWHAIATVLANNTQHVALYPSLKSYASVVFSKSVCSSYSNIKDCPTYAGGLYDPNNTNELGGISYQEPGDGISEDLYLVQNVLNAETNKQAYHKGIDLEIGSAEATSVKIKSAGFIRADSATFKLPPGNVYTPDLGWLSMGGPKTNQTFGDPKGDIVLPVTLNWLASKQQIPSATWGIHVGSVNQKIEGSCVWGGYDSSRIAGPVATYDPNANSHDNFFRFTLNDISIGVATGTNPLGYVNGTKDGLLKRDDGVTAANGSGGSQSVVAHIHSEVPYLYLPRATCDKIAAELPMRFNADYGLYIWDIASTVYFNLIVSPAYLSFTFQYKTSTGFNINVPFALLNLELSYPITPKGESLKYFPCRPYEPPTPDNNIHAYSSYILGRAFLQAAFIGQSWGTDKYWIAQATGPNGPTSNIVTLRNDTTDLNVKVSENTWVDSWASTWKVNMTTIPGGTTPTATSTSKSDRDSKPSKTGPIVGGVVGGIAGLALLGGLALFARRRSRDKRSQDAPIPSFADKKGTSDLPIPYDPNEDGRYSHNPNGYYNGNPARYSELEGVGARAEILTTNEDGLTAVPMPPGPPQPAMELEGSTPSTRSLMK